MGLTRRLDTAENKISETEDNNTGMKNYSTEEKNSFLNEAVEQYQVI